MSIGISIREFARRDDCDPKLVRRAIASGRLRPLPDGTLAAELVGSGWRQTNRRKPAAEGIQKQAERAVAEAVEIPPLADSEAKKEFYLAKLRELEYDLKSGQVVAISDVVAQVGPMLAKVRTRLLAMPSEMAPALNRCKTAAEIEAELRRRITEVLTELSSDWE